MNFSPLIIVGLALLAAGPVVILSGLDLAARKEGREPRVDPIRVGLGGLLDVAGAAALLYAFI